MHINPSGARGRPLAFVALYLVNFCDVLSFSVLLVTFAPLIVSPASPMLPASLGEDTRNFIFGSLIAIFPLAQIFSAPIIGELSDRLGRRKLLMAALLGTSLSWAGVAVAIEMGSIVLLFASRLVAGAFGACTSLGQAGVADLTSKAARGRFMAIFALIGGLGGVVGPWLAAELSKPGPEPWTGLAVPAILVFLLYLTGLVLATLYFQEPLALGPREPLSLAELFKGLWAMFRVKELIGPFVVFTLMVMGWFWFFTFFSPLLEEKLHLGRDQISGLYSYLALWLFLGGCAAHWLLKRYPAMVILIVPQFLIAFSVLAVPSFTRIVHFWIMLAVAGLCQSIASACLFTIMSDLVPERMQGRLFGALAALLAATLSLASQLSGALADLWLGLPALTGGCMLLAGSLAYVVWFLRHRGREVRPQ